MRTEREILAVLPAVVCPRCDGAGAEPDSTHCRMCGGASATIDYGALRREVVELTQHLEWLEDRAHERGGLRLHAHTTQELAEIRQTEDATCGLGLKIRETWRSLREAIAYARGGCGAQPSEREAGA